MKAALGRPLACATDISPKWEMVFRAMEEKIEALPKIQIEEGHRMRKLCSDISLKMKRRFYSLSAFALVALAVAFCPAAGLAQCADMTGSVRGSVRVGSDGWVIGTLTNNSNETLYVFYTFKRNGAPSNDMSNAGATTIRGGSTVGGEGQGLYSTTADKNPPEIYWYAVLQSDKNQGKCSHSW
jgi:hypothetical protein